MAEPYAPLLTRKALVGGAPETVAGTPDAEVTAALVNSTTYDAKLVPVDFFGDGERMPDSQYLGRVASIVGKTLGRLTFRQELRFGDKFVEMLTGAGYKLTTGVYAPTSDMASRETWTMVLWQDGIKKQINGATAQCTLTGERGGRVIAEWDWLGVWVAPVDQAMPAQAPSVHTTALYVARDVTLTIGAAATPLTSQFNIDLGNTIIERPDLTAASSVLHTLISDRAPQIQLDTEGRTVANGAPFADLLAMTEAAFQLVLGDQAASENTLTVDAPLVQKVEVGDEDRDGINTQPIQLQCNADDGDDELTFTAAAGS